MTKLQMFFFPQPGQKIKPIGLSAVCQRETYEVKAIRGQGEFHENYDFITEQEPGKTFSIPRRVYWGWYLNQEGIVWERVEEKCDESES